MIRLYRRRQPLLVVQLLPLLRACRQAKGRAFTIQCSFVNNSSCSACPLV
jgi:hypothetical protein